MLNLRTAARVSALAEAAKALALAGIGLGDWDDVHLGDNDAYSDDSRDDLR